MVAMSRPVSLALAVLQASTVVLEAALISEGHHLLLAGVENVHFDLLGVSTRVEAAAISTAGVNVSFKASLANTLGTLTSALADVELGSDARMAASGGGGGEGLKGYCTGGGGQVEEDMRVEADWKNYGTFYPGKVTDVNKDGTYDVKYDDGFTEKRVKPKNVDAVEEVKKTPPKDDPACEVLDGLEKVKKKIKKANDDVSAWLASQRAKKAAAKGVVPSFTPPPLVLPTASPAPAAGAAPAPEPPLPTIESDDPGKMKKIEELQAKLLAKNEELRELEETVQTNDDEIREAMGGGAGSQGGAKSIDDLISEYESLIDRKQEWIDFLKAKKQQQENQLTSLGASGVSLRDIDDSVAGIEEEVDGLKAKRDELEKADRLDPELRVAVDAIVKQASKLRGKLGNLIAADKKAELQRRRAAERAEARAKNGEHEDEAEMAKEEAEARRAEEEMIKAAEEVDEELHAVDEGAKKLDGGVIPHGDKWWRYRYEHSFVEAVLMIFILFLMVFWERFFQLLRHEAYKRSDLDAYQWMEHSTMYIAWLEFFTGELMVCLLVFLSVWLLGKLNLLHNFAFLLGSGTDHMHLPTTGAEYTHLAIDICVVLFWAICLYFVLALSIVHASMVKLGDWAELDKLASAGADGELSARMTRTFTVGSTPTEWIELKKYFMHHVNTHPELRAQVFGDMETGDTDFPLWMYLRANVREGTDVFFKFGVLPWSMIIATFLVFMCLHYYMHMGYIRIMCFFLGLLAVQLICLVWFVSGINKTLSEARASRESKRPTDEEATIHNRYSTEKVVALSCFYNLFILCYGIARVVCQPWMWEQNFWAVTYLALATTAMVLVFVILVAPLFPVFIAVMSLPPYVDPDNILIMKQCVTEGRVDVTQFLNLRQSASPR